MDLRIITAGNSFEIKLKGDRFKIICPEENTCWDMTGEVYVLGDGACFVTTLNNSENLAYLVVDLEEMLDEDNPAFFAYNLNAIETKDNKMRGIFSELNNDCEEVPIYGEWIDIVEDENVVVKY